MNKEALQDCANLAMIYIERGSAAMNEAFNKLNAELKLPRWAVLAMADEVRRCIRGQGVELPTSRAQN